MLTNRVVYNLNKLFFNRDLAERYRVFEDRIDAGMRLGEWLRDLGVRADVVFGIPAGGVPIAFEVARAVESKLDVLVCRKILLPWNREAGFGAVAPDGSFFYDSVLAAYLGLSPDDVLNAIREQIQEVRRRLEVYRCGEPYNRVNGETVIIVDDGIAAGFTMRAASRFAKKLGFSGIVIAVPTCHTGSAALLSEVVDELYCMNPRSGRFYAVADAYIHWRDLEDIDVLETLRQAKKKGLLAYAGDCI